MPEVQCVPLKIFLNAKDIYFHKCFQYRNRDFVSMACSLDDVTVFRDTDAIIPKALEILTILHLRNVCSKDKGAERRVSIAQ